MASKDVVYVMSIEPVKIHFKLKRPGNVRDGALPYLSWRPDLRRGKNAFKQNSDPMLVIAWGAQILMLRERAAQRLCCFLCLSLHFHSAGCALCFLCRPCR